MAESHMRVTGSAPSDGGLWVLAIAHANCIRHMPIVVLAEEPATP